MSLPECLLALEEKQTTEFDPEVSVIMSRVPQNEDEDIHQTAEKIIHEGLRLPEICVVRAMRLRQREASIDQGSGTTDQGNVHLPHSSKWSFLTCACLAGQAELG